MGTAENGSPHIGIARRYFTNGFGKGTASAVPLPPNKDTGFSP